MAITPIAIKTQPIAGMTVSHRIKPTTSNRIPIPTTFVPPFDAIGKRRLRQSGYARENALECIECDRTWSNPAERRRMYVTDDDPPEAVPYCRACASREFDS
jgi:hypothetical protein